MCLATKAPAIREFCAEMKGFLDLCVTPPAGDRRPNRFMAKLLL